MVSLRFVSVQACILTLEYINYVRDRGFEALGGWTSILCRIKSPEVEGKAIVEFVQCQYSAPVQTPIPIAVRYGFHF